MKYTVILSPTDSREIEIMPFNIGRSYDESEFNKSLYQPQGDEAPLSETLRESDFRIVRSSFGALLACADGDNVPTVQEMLGMYHKDFVDWYDAFLKVNPREAADTENLPEPEKKKGEK